MSDSGKDERDAGEPLTTRECFPSDNILVRKQINWTTRNQCLITDGGQDADEIAHRDDIVVGRPINRETIRSVREGILVTCNDNHCIREGRWQGLFPNPELAKEAVESHYDHERRSGEYHFGQRSFTIVRLLDEETAQTVDESSLGLTVEENRLRSIDGSVREVEFPRTTGDVSELVQRGDRILVPPEREQKVTSVTESRSHGLPTWSVGFCGVDLDLVSDQLPPRGQNELIARDGEVYRSFGPDPLAAPAFEVVGLADHQADFARFANGGEARAE
ncbi:hypothetical protein ACFQMF_01795 [Halorubrum rutilum]|uniref:Uncharacterized protein n=1 Tax=Halorubrum rutilum TaxID=1364933 RepID=A0ABD6AHE5_9EURY|nr:hypothetical protein [Halorubrum rutilum]